MNRFFCWFFPVVCMLTAFPAPTVEGIDGRWVFSVPEGETHAGTVYVDGGTISLASSSGLVITIL